MDNSYWISSVKDNKKEYEKLQEEIKTEIAIIGGGLTGLSCGYYLSKENKEIVILEKNTICSHTSGNTTGKITSGHGLFYNYLLQTEGKNKAKQYLEANEKAIENIEKQRIYKQFERISETNGTIQKQSKQGIQLRKRLYIKIGIMRYKMTDRAG